LNFLFILSNLFKIQYKKIFNFSHFTIVEYRIKNLPCPVSHTFFLQQQQTAMSNFFQTKQSVESFTNPSDSRRQVETEKSLLFWQPPCLGGNWTICPFTMQEKKFNCSEQAHMWSKAKFFNDDETAEKILEAEDPKDQMALGRTVKNFDQASWDEAKYNIMVDILMHKFSQNKDYADALLATGTKQLVECSPRDKIYGIGMDAKTFIKKGEDITKTRGENRLGKALMEVRKNLTPI